MPIILPSEDKPVAAKRIDPKLFLMYGPKKVGKTELLTQLPGCLILDGEEGTHTYDKILALDISNRRDIVEVKKEIMAKGIERQKAGKSGVDLFPYRYIAIDTIDSMEDIIDPYITAEYKATTIGKDFKGKSVLELDYGGGYYYLREGIKDILKDLASVCRTLIIVSHLKEKITNKGGNDMVSQDISLTGKLGQIVCAMADAIGYVYRKPGAPGALGERDRMMISFRTGDGVTMGARQKHLAGQTFEFDWSKLFIEDPTLKK